MFQKLPTPVIHRTAFKIIFSFFLVSNFFSTALTQIYQHDFGTSAISGDPYTIPPAVFDTHLSNSSWTNSNSSWTSFSGSSGQAIALNNSIGTPTIVITFDVAAGYQADITGFSFWRQRSSTGAPNWALTINGNAAGSGTAPVTGGNTGLMPVSNSNNLTGTITIIISLSGAPGTGTFRIDDFTLNGSVTTGATLSATLLSGFGDVCTGTTSASKSFIITGTGLNASNVIVGACSGFAYSIDNALFSSTLSLAQPGGSYSKTVYVRFSPAAVQSYDGIIPLSGGGATAVTADASGNGVNTKPGINDGTVSNLTTNSADISVLISSNGCTALSSYGIEYSTTAGFSNGTGTSVSGGTLSGGNFTVNLSALAPAGQVYYFHTYAANGGGITYGAENSFTLLSTSATLSVPPAGAGSLSSFGSICINTALVHTFDLSGSVLNGSNISIGPLSRYSFATSAAGPFSNSLVLTQGGAGYSYSGGILSGCTIYARFIPTAVQSYNGNIPVSGGGAASINVTATGSGINSTATVSTGAAFSITSSSAILPGSITASGCGVILGYGIEYSNTPFTPGSGTQVAGSNLSVSDFSVSLSLLNPNSTYYYYAYVTNAAGLSYGSSNSFTTFPVPSKLAILSVSPASPTALTPFSVTVQAQDNSGNPVDVTTNTGLNFIQSSGTGIFTFPNAPQPAATLTTGSNTIVISDLSYDIAENNVGIAVKASSGMTGLGTSLPKMFNVIAYVGPSNFVWSAAGGSAWLTGSNWSTGTSPGSSTPGLNQHVASFTSSASLNLSAVGGCGINMNGVGGAYDAGSIYFTNTYGFNHVNNIVPVGNSSTTQSGILTLWGAGINNVGGITGNNYSSLLIANYMNTANTTTLEIRNAIGSGTQNMTLNLGSAGAVVAGPGRSINFSTVLAGSQSLTLTGGGVFTLTPAGAATVNSFSGPITIANGMLITGNTGAFNSTTPNIITLGNTSTAGILRLNGHNITIGGLATSGTAGNLNSVDNGNASAVLAISNGAGYTFAGSLKDGSSGSLSLTKSGAGVMTFMGTNTFTGLTMVNSGTLVLARSGGNTFSPGNSITVNGNGILRISSDQTVKNLTLATGGTLTVDAGIVLTITGSYLPGTCNINNAGTIILQGTTAQSFPGSTAAVSNMHNLSINNAGGVTMNAPLNIGGTLNIITGTFTVGVYTLTLNNPISGNTADFIAGATSSLVLAGTATGVDIPAGISQLKNLTISNIAGTVLQADLSVSSSLFITNTAGTVNTGTNRLYGTANTTMSGGILRLARNTSVEPELSGIYLLTGGTIVFEGVGIGSDAQIIRPINYFNLSSASNGDRVLSPTGITGVASIFTPNAGLNNYTVSNSTIEYNRTGFQSVAAFSYYNLTLAGGGTYTKTLAGNIDVQGTLELTTNTKLALGNFNVTLKSNTGNTANVAAISTANSITYGSGRFIAERYIPTGINHGKSWQLLSIPVSGVQSVKDGWQEGNGPLANSVPGFGTTISSEKAGATSRGYDFYTPSGPSIKTYNSVTNGWDGIDDGAANTGGLPISNSKGYMIFVRGDRSVQSSATPATLTTLRTAGRLYAPGVDAPLSTTIAAGNFESVGNPYASALDFTNLQITSSGIDDKYYVWDPLLPGTSGYGYGGYQLLSSVNMWKPVPGGTANYPANVPYTQIQSGQAFFVYSTGGGTVNFSESNKLSGSTIIYRSMPSANTQFLRVNLYGATGNLADGNVVAFNSSFSNNTDADDAMKQETSAEAFGIRRNGHIFSLEARVGVVTTDTVFYSVSGLNVQDYQFRFGPENLAFAGLNAYLIDRYKNTSSPVSLSDSTIIDFSITADPASKDADRFYLVFKKTRSGQDHPVTTDSSAIDIAATRGNGLTGTAAKPGKVSQSNKYVQENNNNAAVINIYPNPLTGKVVNLSFVNVPAGDYAIEIINMAAQPVYKTRVNTNGRNQDLSIYAGNIAAGMYKIKILNKTVQFVQEIIVQ